MTKQDLLLEYKDSSTYKNINVIYHINKFLLKARAPR